MASIVFGYYVCCLRSIVSSNPTVNHRKCNMKFHASHRSKPQKGHNQPVLCCAVLCCAVLCCAVINVGRFRIAVKLPFVIILPYACIGAGSTSPYRFFIRLWLPSPVHRHPTVFYFHCNLPSYQGGVPECHILFFKSSIRSNVFRILKILPPLQDRKSSSQISV